MNDFFVTVAEALFYLFFFFSSELSVLSVIFLMESRSICFCVLLFFILFFFHESFCVLGIENKLKMYLYEMTVFNISQHIPFPYVV